MADKNNSKEIIFNNLLKILRNNSTTVETKSFMMFTAVDVDMGGKTGKVKMYTKCMCADCGEKEPEEEKAKAKKQDSITSLSIQICKCCGSIINYELAGSGYEVELQEIEQKGFDSSAISNFRLLKVLESCGLENFDVVQRVAKIVMPNAPWDLFMYD